MVRRPGAPARATRPSPFPGEARIRTYPGGMAGLPNEGAVPVDFASPVGRVRLLIGDTDADPLTLDATSGTGTYVFFSDAEIEAFLTTRGGNTNRAAATILRAIAASQALKLKKWSSADLLVDGSAIANSLLAAARAFEQEADASDVAAGGEATFVRRTGGFAWETLGII